MSQPQVLLQSRRFRVIRHQVAARDGRLHAHDVVEHPGSITILPILADGRVCLIRNRRPAVGQTLIELPAGTLEGDENPESAALRELAEETGYRADHVRLLTEFWMSPGLVNERMRLYLATGLVDGQQQLDASEEIDRWVVPWDEALALVASGAIQDAKTLVGLLWYERFGPRGKAPAAE